MPRENDSGTREDLVNYRLETAGCDLKSAKLLFDSGDYRGANNRAYYSIYHAVNAIHGMSGKGYKRHKDAIGIFNKEYVKTNIFPRDIGRKISESVEIRHASDYDDFYLASREESERQITTAEEFLQMAQSYCRKKMNNTKENPNDD